MFILCFTLLILIAKDCASQDDEGPYRGKFIGKLNSYHHQVSGDVYAVDDLTVLLVNFNYDGTGEDTFFWAGDSGRPGPQGFIIPDEHGKTNILERYNGAEVVLRLAEGKRLSRLRWLAVYDVGTQNAFGDVYVPDEFDPPAPRSLGPLVPAPAAPVVVSSKSVRFLDANTFLIPEFRYDGSGEEVYFWAGVGPQPSARGFIVPNEHGYLEPLRAYRGEDVTLELPGGRTVFEVDWLALWDAGERRALAALLVPDALNVPPAKLRTHPHRTRLPHCKQLHRDYQVAWEVFGNQITIELAAQVEEGEYMAFGVSGNETRSQMVGADVAVAYFNSALQQATVADYNVTAVAPCVQVLGRWAGVCRDERGGGLNNNQVFSSSRQDGLTVVTYRRSLQPDETMDLAWRTEGVQYAVWAVGRLDALGEPAYHRLYPRADLALRLAAAPPNNDCFDFVIGERARARAWERAELFDPALRVFRLSLGPAGGARGLWGREPRVAAPHLAWYVNGQLAPDLQLRRGLHYTFKVSGGNEPHSAALYHPLVVTAEPHGGLERLDDAAQRAVRVLAGARPTRRARLAPAPAGPLCLAARPPEADPRLDGEFATFRAFNRSLRWSCAPGEPAQLALAPDSSWPDIVYYHSFTHADMGGRIFVVDKHRRNIARGAAPPPLAAPALALALALGALGPALLPRPR
ncbi:PREDICTED: protein Skeletor, isoforms B/C [Papilio xuthus]|uniref:Protein Skeletor, isoforms B/C n=1 Tax=Papilio xuthus TaxID=66420 RepID=A0AAJ7E7A2_PAPXU|nr:PREDICTED: protein Skeletor, isoforms B/C [Papilio xuthus]